MSDRDPLSSAGVDRAPGQHPRPDDRLFQPPAGPEPGPGHAATSPGELAQVRVQMADLRTAVMTRLDEVQSAVFAAVEGLTRELRAESERAGASTVAALGNDLVELRMALNGLLAADTTASDSIARLRGEGMLELRQGLVEDVESTIERAASAMAAVTDTGQAKGVEALRAELALFGVAFSQREQDGTKAGLAELSQALEWLRDEVSGVHVTVQDVVAEAGSATSEGLANLEAALRDLIERTNADAAAELRTAVAAASGSDTAEVARLRTTLESALDRLGRDVAGLEPSLGQIERVGGATADGVAGLRSQVHEQFLDLRQTMSEVVAAGPDVQKQVLELRRAVAAVPAQVNEQLVALRQAVAEGVAGVPAQVNEQLVALRQAVAEGVAGVPAQVNEQLVALRQAVAEGVAGVPAQVNEQLVALRQAVVAGFQAEARARETALLQATDELQGQVTGLDRQLSAALEASDRAARDHVESLRKIVEAAIGEVRSALGDMVSAQDADSINDLRSELRSTVHALESTLTSAQHDQRRALRNELADALVSVSELVIDSARTEAQSREAAFDSAAHRIDQLAAATAAVVGAQAELRDMLLELWGR